MGTGCDDCNAERTQGCMCTRYWSARQQRSSSRSLRTGFFSEILTIRTRRCSAFAWLHDELDGQLGDISPELGSMVFVEWPLVLNEIICLLRRESPMGDEGRDKVIV